jgi:hypothetical protein
MLSQWDRYGDWREHLHWEYRKYIYILIASTLQMNYVTQFIKYNEKIGSAVMHFLKIQISWIIYNYASYT